MKVERGFKTDDVIYECLLLGEEIGELFKAVRKAETGRIAEDSESHEVSDELGRLFDLSMQHRFPDGS